MVLAVELRTRGGSGRGLSSWLSRYHVEKLWQYGSSSVPGGCNRTTINGAYVTHSNVFRQSVLACGNADTKGVELSATHHPGAWVSWVSFRFDTDVCPSYHWFRQQTNPVTYLPQVAGTLVLAVCIQVI